MGNILGTAKDSEPQAQYVILLENWSLGQFAQKFKVEGWDDPRYWHEMTDNDLNEMGFKKGHIVKFKNQLNEWRKKNNLNQMNENEQKRNDENEEQKQPELGLYELTRKLTDLGFTVEISLNAATKYTGDIDAAINWIHQQQQNNVDVKPVHDHKEIKKDEETDISKDFLSNISVILDNDHNIFENNPFALAITNDNDKKLNIGHRKRGRERQAIRNTGKRKKKVSNSILSTLEKRSKPEKGKPSLKLLADDVSERIGMYGLKKKKSLIAFGKEYKHGVTFNKTKIFSIDHLLKLFKGIALS
eukprot:210000_1